MKQLTVWCYGYHGCGTCDGACEAMSDPLKHTPMAELDRDNVATKKGKAMNDEMHSKDEEVAILAVMQTPEFQRIQTDFARHRFLKLATAYWDLSAEKRRRKARSAVVTEIQKKA
jgi:hypothetical protein